MSAQASISHLAYKKLILHTAKYPTNRVFGFLLGTKSSSSNTGSFDIVDSIPLSHHWTSLAPMAEVGLSLATAYATSQSLQVIGLYEAPELVGERTPSQQASKLCEKIATILESDALLLLVNNSTLLSPTNHSLLAFSLSPNTSSTNSSKAEAKPKNLPGSAIALKDNERAKELENDVRKTRSWEKLVDFDDHLENPHLDWLKNPSITA